VTTAYGRFPIHSAGPNSGRLCNKQAKSSYLFSLFHANSKAEERIAGS